MGLSWAVKVCSGCSSPRGPQTWDWGRGRLHFLCSEQWAAGRWSLCPRKAGRCSLLPASEVLQNSIHVLFFAQSFKEWKQVQQFGVGHIIEPWLYRNLWSKTHRVNRSGTAKHLKIHIKTDCAQKLIYTHVAHLTNIKSSSLNNAKNCLPSQTQQRCGFFFSLTARQERLENLVSSSLLNSPFWLVKKCGLNFL